VIKVFTDFSNTQFKLFDRKDIQFGL